jgi:hypothetical protein
MKRPFWASPWLRWLIPLLFLTALINGFGIINTMVSLKYETEAPGQCLSSVTGHDLCAALQRCKMLALGAFIGAFALVL